MLADESHLLPAVDVAIDFLLLTHIADFASESVLGATCPGNPTYRHPKTKMGVTSPQRNTEKVSMLNAKTSLTWLGVVGFAFIVCFPPTVNAQVKETPGAVAINTYRIGIGDYIKVEVDGHPGISKRWSTVDPNGNVVIPSTYSMKSSGISIIDFQPFAFCVVRASGLTIQDFADGLKHKLEVIIPNPQLRIIVRPASFGTPGPALWDAPSPKCCAT